MTKELLYGFSVSEEGLGVEIIMEHKTEGIYAVEVENKHKICWKGLVLCIMVRQNFVLENLLLFPEPEMEVQQSNSIVKNVIFLPFFLLNTGQGAVVSFLLVLGILDFSSWLWFEEVLTLKPEIKGSLLRA